MCCRPELSIGNDAGKVIVEFRKICVEWQSLFQILQPDHGHFGNCIVVSDAMIKRVHWASEKLGASCLFKGSQDTRQFLFQESPEVGRGCWDGPNSTVWNEPRACGHGTISLLDRDPLFKLAAILLCFRITEIVECDGEGQDDAALDRHRCRVLDGVQEHGLDTLSTICLGAHTTWLPDRVTIFFATDETFRSDGILVVVWLLS
jgi:hypothetical protein